MQDCLHIAIMQHHLLVDARHVREVLELEMSAEQDSNGFCLWRGVGIQVIDLREMLGEAEPPPPLRALVYEECANDRPLMLLCDKVFGLVKTEESALRCLPPASGSMTEFIDGILSDGDRRQIFFHLKQGIFRDPPEVVKEAHHRQFRPLSL